MWEIESNFKKCIFLLYLDFREIEERQKPRVCRNTNSIKLRRLESLVLCRHFKGEDVEGFVSQFVANLQEEAERLWETLLWRLLKYNKLSN